MARFQLHVRKASRKNKISKPELQACFENEEGRKWKHSCKKLTRNVSLKLQGGIFGLSPVGKMVSAIVATENSVNKMSSYFLLTCAPHIEDLCRENPPSHSHFIHLI